MSHKIIILDTTLRDGEQSLQKSLHHKEKLKIAYALEKLGVDIMEVGFPISSPGDFKSVQNISKFIKNTRICSLARCIKKDIDIAAKAMNFSKNFRIHIFLGTSNLHIYSKLRKNFSEIIDMAVSSVKYALKYTDDIQFSCEDAVRTSIDNLCEIIEKVIQAGAKTINIPDTVGYSIPSEFYEIISNVKSRVPNIDKAIISVHCHNDLGLAVGNSIAAIQAGARQIEGTINGIGERAGNTALEEIILAIKVRKKKLNFSTNNINYKEIYNTSKIVSKLCNIPISIHKSIIGKNAFSHSSGIHQDGVLKNRENYEIIDPKCIGLKKNIFNLTSRSGRAIVKYKMKKMGYSELNYDINNLYDKFIKLADIKGKVFDYDLECLAFSDNITFKKYYKLHSFSITINSLGLSIINIKLICGKKKKKIKFSTKNGLVYAIYKSLKKISNFSLFFKKVKLTLENKKIKKRKKIVKVETVLLYKNRLFYGFDLSYDILKSLIKSIINILNDIYYFKKIILNLKI